MEIFDLTGAHRAALESFDCKTFKQPWTVQIDRMVHELPGPLAGGEVFAIGGWVDGTLASVEAWAVDDSRWRSVLVATAIGYRRRGYATELKSALIDRARAAGASSIVSFVHRDNVAMCAVNDHLGGKHVQDPVFPRSDHLIYEIRL